MINLHKIGENTTHNKDFFVDRPNGHPVYLLLLIKTPSLFLSGDEWQRIPADCAVIFRPGQTHCYRADNTDYTNCWLHFSSPHDILEKHFPYGTPIPLHDSEDFYQLFHLIYREYYRNSRHRNQTLHDLASALIARISDAHNIKEYPAIYYNLLQLREEIYRSPPKNWTVPAMAEKLNISTGYLQNIYPKYFGTTCLNEVIESRIQYACELLFSTHMPLSDISEECGYRNVEHFIRQFKSRMNMTPGSYRKSKEKS